MPELKKQLDMNKNKQNKLLNNNKNNNKSTNNNNNNNNNFNDLESTMSETSLVSTSDTLSNGNFHKKSNQFAWEEEKKLKKDFFDDGSISFFWKAHRLTALLIFSLVLLYITLYDDPSNNMDYNIKRGIIAVIISFVVFGVTITPDGPFQRPHPALWRFALVLSIVYELALIFLLFQRVDVARQLMKQFDSNLGKPLPEKDYGGNCRIYDSENKQDPWHNLKDKMDGFVAVHFFGWWVKTLIVRDWWLCLVTSVLFEFMEYTLEHQLPNFSECWWDHWLMDVLICNNLGIYLGMITCKYLSMKTYHWRSLWSYPTYRGKLTRILRQFTPYIYTDFDWRPTESLKRWLTMVFIVLCILVSELNTFTLKFVLWIPPTHFLCLSRLILFFMWGAVALREAYQYLDDPNCNKLGAQSLLILTILLTELFIAFKFDWSTFTKPIPTSVLPYIILGLIILLLWTIWYFYINRILIYTEKKLKIKYNNINDDNKDKKIIGKDKKNE